MLVSVRLVTAALYSDVAYVRFANGFLYSDLYGGSVANLMRIMLPLLEVGLRFDELELEGHIVFIVLCHPRSTVSGVLARLCYQSVGDADSMGL